MLSLIAISFLSAGAILSPTLATLSRVMISREDYRSRAVHWFWFPLLALGGLLLSLGEGHSFDGTLVNTGLNLLFLSLQFVLLKGYFSLRQKIRPAGPRPSNANLSAKLSDKIGAGDICFLIAACCAFSPLNFILFYLCSLLFAMLVWLSRRLLNRRFDPSIPLAGLQASFFILVLWACLILKVPLSNDDLLLSKLTQP
jgi:hypothetical protein